MDFQCLFITARLLHRPFSPLRGAVFASLGALYACAALFLPFHRGVALACDLAVCLLMCVGVYFEKGCKITHVFIPFALYFGVSAAVGGVMSAIGTLLSRLPPVSAPAASGISSFGFFLLAAAGGLATYLWGRLCQRRAKGRHAVLRLVLEERELRVEGLIDTANLLCDPVGGRPVVILERATALSWLPAPIALLLCEDSTRLERLPTRLATRVRLLPADTVAGGGMLLAVSPEQAFLDVGRGEHPVEVLVAPCAREGSLHGCKALLPARLITE